MCSRAAVPLARAAGAEPDLKNKWGATALDNAKFADHHGSISLLSTDPGERKAAESRLVLERKLRPTEEERELKLQELAADAVARREAGRARLQGMAEQREAQEAAIKDKAQVERRMRAADNVLCKALVPAASKKTAVLGTNVHKVRTVSQQSQSAKSVSQSVSKVSQQSQSVSQSVSQSSGPRN